MITLGVEYTDTITGYTGIATERNEILGGAVSVKLERPDATKKPEHVWLSETRLRPVEERSAVGITAAESVRPDAPAYIGETYTICLCPRCGQFLGYPGWNSKCDKHSTRGDHVEVMVTVE